MDGRHVPGLDAQAPPVAGNTGTPPIVTGGWAGAARRGAQKSWNQMSEGERARLIQKREQAVKAAFSDPEPPHVFASVFFKLRDPKPLRYAVRGRRTGLVQGVVEALGIARIVSNHTICCNDVIQLLCIRGRVSQIKRALLEHDFTVLEDTMENRFGGPQYSRRSAEENRKTTANRLAFLFLPQESIQGVPGGGAEGL